MLQILHYLTTMKNNKRKPPQYWRTEAAQISEEILISQTYCIIFGGSTQAERLCVVFLYPILRKEDDIMATAKKLPSGSWRCQVLSHTEEYTKPDGTIGKRKIRKSFTCDDPTKRGKRICEQMATEWAASKEQNSIASKSLKFGEALEDYISSRENILSPCTIRDYRGIQRNYIPSLMEIKIDDITQDDIQKAINLEAVKLSPKTVRNIHGLISAVLRVYRPSMALNTALPKKKRVELYIPSDAEVKILMNAVQGTELEIPVLLAAFGPMRRGEICALEHSDINGNVIHVCKNMVRTIDNRWIIKTPKSFAGDRYIDFPDDVIRKLPGRPGRVVSLNPGQLTDKFEKCLKKCNLPHFRFHDLRHYSASILHALGIPDVYIMQRGGWGNDGTLKAVYRHALSDKAQEMNKLANEHFEDLLSGGSHESSHKRKKP